MSAQRNLFPPPPADGNLKPKQQQILDLLHDHPQGLRTIDIGRHLHHQDGCNHCNPERTCRFAIPNATSLLESMGTRKRQLVIKRKTGLWQLVNPPVTGYDPSKSDIPF